MTGKELGYIRQAHLLGQLSGDGPFTKKCHEELERQTGARRALLTHSCTAALEMSAILAKMKPGDEVVMPSFTFVTTANAFVLRGAVPVFVDIRPDTFNIDETKIEAAITKRTVAIVAVHYAGIACEMDAIMRIARRHNLMVIEDAAQGFRAAYKGKHLGTIGHLGTLSFHETKNVVAGEGGALLVNAAGLVERAEIVREKGTNRSRFFRGQVDKYTWVDIGSSYLPGELIAAFLRAQLEASDRITSGRLKIWNKYHSAFSGRWTPDRIQLPHVPAHCTHNAHMYYLVLPGLKARSGFIEKMRGLGINSVFHYVPLHSSPAGRKFCRAAGGMPVTNRAGTGLVRLPLWLGMRPRDVDSVISGVLSWAKTL